MAMMMETTQRMQSEAFKAFGLVVKNTFIDDAAPAVEEDSPASRRASSVPAAMRMAYDQEADEKLGVKSCPPGAYAKRGRGRHATTYSDSSTTCSGREFSPTSSITTSTSTSMCCSTPTECIGLSWAESMDSEDEAEAVPEAESSSDSEVDGEDQTAELTALVERDCAFLRLAGHQVYDETSHLRRRRGVSKCVVFYCRGLPWAKRAKWLLPLLWSVAAVLKARGCTCKVQAGELYAQLPSARKSGTAFVRVDFGAAHI
jgi:hypothetical protein